MVGTRTRTEGSTVPTIGVLALQGDVREHVRMLQEAGATAHAVRRPAELDAVDGLVIPGGESTTMWKLAETFDMLQPLRMRIKEGMPAYGSCAGMIMLADRIEDGIAGQQTIGGIDMVVRRNAFGRQVDSFEEDLDFAGDRVHAVFIRAPWVESVGGDVEVLGRCEPGDRIVAVRQGPLLATSFHPELTGDARVHRYFVDMVREL
ncbi:MULTISPECIES: pyridoxal 5'-phosphate synthase glutaminase subunit PdxT [unclassified Nonomuraea]|uniref:pyridoxal 5'-phosphate synthase glutaminase subunit PdxT n=1 Tax=unclassified Nonomuraea TaxID=2593643 RepID=UPI002E175B7B